MRDGKTIWRHPSSLTRLLRCAGLGALLLGLGLGCGDSHKSPSLVAMGDSIASGEGTLYGWTYDAARQVWAGPQTPDPAWDPPYPLCHQSPFAYPQLVAAAIGARLDTFACSGATYGNGIASPQTFQGTALRPAQFGVYQTRQNLNLDYDAAMPDLVIVTLGANDVRFSQILAACIVGSVADMSEVDTAIATGQDPGPALASTIGKNLSRLELAIELKRSGIQPEQTTPRVCTRENPGMAVQTLFFDQLPTLRQSYRELLSGIAERGAAAGKVPRVVMTTYHKPLPPVGSGAFTGCPDLINLDGEQVTYLSSLQDVLADLIIQVAGEFPGVSVADIRSSMDGHEFCSSDPWTYGLSILLLPGQINNPSPFHPTPDGQGSIASIVEQTVRATLR